MGRGRVRAWLDAGRRLTRPDWAVRHGVDQAGWWAEFAVGPVVQRMRWVPPGEFLMGSPEDEAGRWSGEALYRRVVWMLERPDGISWRAWRLGVSNCRIQVH